MAVDPRQLVEGLGLEAHPEGGWYRRLWESPDLDADGRPAGTATLYLLAEGERAHWHRIDADERWQLLSGGPLRLSISPDAVATDSYELHAPGEDHVVPAHVWQAAEPLGSFAVVVVSVTPGFVWEGHELAPPDWAPGP